MKRFLLELALFAALQLVVAAGWQAYRARHADTYLACVADKERLLATAPDPRIVFVGGSNLAFGLDSELVERRLGRHPVNMGVYAGFGLPFMLAQARASLRPGDIVVLSPEYEHFVRAELATTDMPTEQWAIVAWLSPRSLRFAPWPALRRLFLTPRGAGELLKVCRQREDRSADQVYRRANVNRYGDAVLPPGCADGVFSYRERVGVPLPPNRATTEAMALRVRHFAEWCHDHGVRVLWAWPALPAERYRGYATTLDEIEEVVTRWVPAETLGRLRESALPVDRFFDTEYHLNRTGRRERSEFLCERLARALGPDGTARACRPEGDRP